MYEFDHVDQMSIDITQQLDMAETAIRESERGRLVLGSLAEAWNRGGLSYDGIRTLLRNRGVTLPSNSRLSAYRHVYLAWVERANVDMDEVLYHPDFVDSTGTQIGMTLTGTPIDKLWYLNGEVVADNSEELLAWVNNHTDEECRMRKAGREGEDDRPRTLTLNQDSFGQFRELLERLRNVTGISTVSKAQLFDFMVERFSPDYVDDDTLGFLWRESHGEVEEEELAALYDDES